MEKIILCTGSSDRSTYLHTFSIGNVAYLFLYLTSSYLGQVPTWENCRNMGDRAASSYLGLGSSSTQ